MISWWIRQARYTHSMKETRIETNQNKSEEKIMPNSTSTTTINTVNPFRTAVSFWGKLGTNYLEFECLVPKTGLEF